MARRQPRWPSSSEAASPDPFFPLPFFGTCFGFPASRTAGVRASIHHATLSICLEVFCSPGQSLSSWSRYDGAHNERIDMFNGQLEMGFGNGNTSPTRRQRRLTRAQWWFQRMRQVVDRALDWQPAPTPRPEQIWFPGAHRQVGAGAGRNPDERQMCE
jgi:hypothetical protein